MTKQILMKGNIAIGEGAIQAGCQAYFGYPITPQNEIIAYMSKRMVELKRVFIQAESEISAINMVFGSALTGARAMTSSSSPGISLKQEGISYMAGCELPGVIVNVQRGGPGLGNIAGSQSDYFQATRGGGHGDYRTLVLAPHSVQEMYDFVQDAFDLAEKYRNPVVVLTDGVLGQMMEPIKIDIQEKPATRHKDKLKDSPRGEAGWILDGCKGRKPRSIKSLFMREGALEEHNWKLHKKYEKMKEEVKYETKNLEEAEIILVAFGISARVCKSGMQIANRKGIKTGLIRPITLYPFPEDIIFMTADKTKKFLVVEMNLGQMVEDVKLAVCGKASVHFYGRPGGGIPSQEEILNEIIKIVEKQ